MNVRKRGAERSNHLRPAAGQGEDLVNEINGQKIVRPIGLPLIKDALNETADHRFVLRRWHESSYLSWIEQGFLT